MLIYCQFLVGTDASDIWNKTYFLYYEYIGKFIFVIFRLGLNVLMSIERFASIPNYRYNTICGFSILYCCLRKNSWLDDISEENEIESVSTQRYKLNSHNLF